MKYDIFISYRRSGGQDLARMIKESLTARGYNVFLDFDGLKDGHFDEKIMKAIDEAPVFILVLSKGSMARCVDEDDWVRKEIEYALSKGKQIIPVDPNHEFDGFPEGMPSELKEQIGQHQFSLLDTTQLYRESLDKIVKERIAPIWASARKKRLRPILYTILALVGIGVASLVYYACRPTPEEMYQRGIAELETATTHKDTLKALEYVTQAAKRADESAVYTMGYVSYYGIGLEQSYEEARYWFEQAKEYGSVGAYYHLGLMYLYGNGVQKNESKGIEHLQVAIDNSDEYGAMAYCEMGKYVAKYNEYAKAAQYYTRGFLLRDKTSNAAECGYELGKLHLEGKGIEKQYYLGLQLLHEVATRFDYYESLLYLGHMGCKISFDMSYSVGNELQLIVYGLQITENEIRLITKFQNNTSSPIIPNSFRDVTYITQDGQQTYAIADVMHADNDILHTTINPGEASVSFALVCPRSSNDWKFITLCFNKQDSLMIKDIPLDNCTQFGLFIDDVVTTDEETVLTGSYTTAYPFSGWYCWEPTTYIQTAEMHEKLPILKTDGCSLAPERTDVRFGETATFKLYFPSLPPGVSRFDLIEEDGSTFNKYNLNVMHDQRTIQK